MKTLWQHIAIQYNVHGSFSVKSRIPHADTVSTISSLWDIYRFDFNGFNIYVKFFLECSIHGMLPLKFKMLFNLPRNLNIDILLPQFEQSKDKSRDRQNVKFWTGVENSTSETTFRYKVNVLLTGMNSNIFRF